MMFIVKQMQRGRMRRKTVEMRGKLGKGTKGPRVFGNFGTITEEKGNESVVRFLRSERRVAERKGQREISSTLPVALS
jgi:hypothetical protein